VASSDWLSLDESGGDTWHDYVQWKGATWPNEGLPRGTHLCDVGLTFGLLKVDGGHEVQPPDLPSLEHFNIDHLPTHHMCGFIKHMF
jgi:hypothetical protein